MTDDFDEIEQRVRTVIQTVLQAEASEITRESTIEELGGDSLSALGILSALEQEFELDIADEDAMKIDSFAKAVEIVKARQSE